MTPTTLGPEEIKAVDLSDEALMRYDFTHLYSGNGWAVVSVSGPGWVYVTDTMCQFNQAFLAARDHLLVTWLSPKLGGPIAPVELDETQLERLKLWRDGLKDGSINIISTRFISNQTGKPVIMPLPKLATGTSTE